MPRAIQAVLAAFLPLLPLLFSEDGGTSHDWASHNVPDPQHTQPPPALVQSVRSDYHLARDLNYSLTPEWLVNAVTTPVDDKLPVLEVLDAIRSRLILELSHSPVRLSVGLFAVSLLVFVVLVIRLLQSKLFPQAIDAIRPAEGDTSINSMLGVGGNADLLFCHGAKRFFAEPKPPSPPIPLISHPTSPLANTPDQMGTDTEIQAATPSLRDTPGNSSLNESPTSFSPPSLTIGHILASLARSRVAPAQSESCESLKDIDVRDANRPSPPRPYWSLDRACEGSLYSHSDPSTCHTAPSSPQPGSDQEQLDDVGPGDDHLSFISDVDEEHEAFGRERALSDITERTEPGSDIEAPGTPCARWFSRIHRRLASLDIRSGLILGAETTPTNPSLSAASSPELPHESSSATLHPSATVSAPRLVELQLPSRNTQLSLGLALLDVPEVHSDVDVDGPEDEGDGESEHESLSGVCWNVLKFPSDRIAISEAYQSEHEHQSDSARSTISDPSSWDLDDASATIILDEVRVELYTAGELLSASDWSLVGSPSASVMDEANTNRVGGVGSETRSSSRAGMKWNVIEAPECGPPPTLSLTPEPWTASIALEAEVDDISTRLEVDRVSPEVTSESGASAGTAVPSTVSHSTTDFSEGSADLVSPLRGLVARVLLGKTESPSAIEIDSVLLVENSPSATLLLPAERALPSARVSSDGVDEDVSLQVTTGVPLTPTPQARVFMRPTNEKVAHARSSQPESPLRSRSRVSTSPPMLMVSFSSALGYDRVEHTASQFNAEPGSAGDDDTIVWEPAGRPHPRNFDRTQDTNPAIHEDEQDDIFASHRRASSHRIDGGQVLTRPVSGATRRARVSFTGGRFDPLPPHVVVQ
ncbi:hypothetical protein C8Q74DRAFT_1219129 [Fomes fomentarius]|nr:hypothetical protein C8Q74DRAFT_1219129 [Fomes fomentarius]